MAKDIGACPRDVCFTPGIVSNRILAHRIGQPVGPLGQSQEPKAMSRRRIGAGDGRAEPALPGGPQPC